MLSRLRYSHLFPFILFPIRPVAETADRKIYPAMSQEEVEEWLGHIPVFAVTDANGSGVVLKPDNETSVFYFFMSPMMANATLQTLKGANEDMDLKIAAFSLGKIWFSVLNADKDKEVMVSFICINHTVEMISDFGVLIVYFIESHCSFLIT